MKNANRTWTDATLDDYLTNPRQKIPGVKMIFAGLPEESDRQNVIAYLSTLK
jgi:cytochrome c